MTMTLFILLGASLLIMDYEDCMTTKRKWERG